MPKFLVHLTAAFVAFTSAQSWAQTFQTVYSFPGDGAQGAKPQATLTVGPDRLLYGTAAEGGSEGSGTAFKYAPGGAFTNLGSFQVAVTGKASKARLVSLDDGFLYGATSLGTGTAGQPIGTVFKLDPAGGLSALFPLPGSGIDPKVPMSLTSGSTGILHVLGSSPGGLWRVPVAGGLSTVAFNFPPSGDSGLFPWRIMKASDGNLYGVTTGTSYVDETPGRQGTIFRIAPDGTGFTTLHDCSYATGVAPLGNLVEGPDGSLYGTMSAGGTNGDGVIFKLTPQGQYTVLYSINDHAPAGDLLLASDGKLYGTAPRGGTGLVGSIFRINTNGTGFQILYSFKGTGNVYPNGAYPDSGLVQADDGDLYGVTSGGGTGAKGTIYRVDLNLPAPAINRAPVAINDFAFSNGAAVAVNVTANDLDPDGDTLVVTIESNPTHGTAVVETSGQITYTPTLGNYNGTDAFTYRITDPDGLFAIGEVSVSDEQPPAAWQPGFYSGIVNLDPNLEADDQTPRGQLNVTITTNGKFTGKLFALGKKLSVRGAFTESGIAVATVKIPRQKPAILFLAPAEGNTLYTVIFGQEIWSGAVAPRWVPNPAVKTTYTAALVSGSAGLPLGHGYASVRLLANGSVRAAGKMGDGTKLSWGTTLVSIPGFIAIPIYAEPTRGGFCGGYFATTGGTGFLGALRWSRLPAKKNTLPYFSGFTGDLNGVMDLFTPPARGALPIDFGVDLSGGAQASGPAIATSTGLITVQGTRLLVSDPLRSFSINRSTGLFSGKIKATTVGTNLTKTLTISGAILQSLKSGYGFYTLNKATGPVIFDSD